MAANGSVQWPTFNCQYINMRGGGSCVLSHGLKVERYRSRVFYKHINCSNELQEWPHPQNQDTYSKCKWTVVQWINKYKVIVENPIIPNMSIISPAGSFCQEDVEKEFAPGNRTEKCLGRVDSSFSRVEELDIWPGRDEMSWRADVETSCDGQVRNCIHSLKGRCVPFLWVPPVWLATGYCCGCGRLFELHMREINIYYKIQMSLLFLNADSLKQLNKSHARRKESSS